MGCTAVGCIRVFSYYSSSLSVPSSSVGLVQIHRNQLFSRNVR